MISRQELPGGHDYCLPPMVDLARHAWNRRFQIPSHEWMFADCDSL